MKLLCFALCLGLTASAVALDLVRDGQPVAAIVTTIPREAPEPAAPVKGKAPKRKAAVAETDEALAVRVLGEWVKKITDAELPIADKAPASGPAIYVGQAALAAGLRADRPR